MGSTVHKLSEFACEVSQISIKLGSELYLDFTKSVADTHTQVPAARVHTSTLNLVAYSLWKLDTAV